LASFEELLSGKALAAGPLNLEKPAASALPLTVVGRNEQTRHVPDLRSLTVRRCQNRAWDGVKAFALLRQHVARPWSGIHAGKTGG